MSLNLKKELKTGEQTQISMDENGVAIIPEGYKWCVECIALTPQNFDKWSSYCKVCGCREIRNSMDCPNCGYPEPDDGPICSDEQGHLPGCHFNEYEYGEETDDGLYSRIFKVRAKIIFEEFVKGLSPSRFRVIEKWIKEQREKKCDCPEFRVFPFPNIHNYKVRSVFSMDCMNAVEWSFNVRCEKCGYIYDVEDGNC